MLVVVIPTKNRRALLERALKSVLSQSHPQWRAVVIDDGSSDATREYLASVHDPRVQVVRHEKSKGVNAARNAGFRTLCEGEWAVPLDDDDYFLPGAFEIIARVINETPADVPILQFPTIVESPDEVYAGGAIAFTAGQAFVEPTYEETMIGFDFGGRGESRTALKWTLFPKYLFNEDVNGFEGEWSLLVSRDCLRTRFVNTPPVIYIDWGHTGPHLSFTAARDNRASFARTHARIFRDHARFLAAHPGIARERAAHAFRIAVRSVSPCLAAYFLYQYILASARLALSKAS